MTRTQARRVAKQMEQDGWTDVQVMASDDLSRVSFGVSGTDPTTGYRSAWRFRYEQEPE